MPVGGCVILLVVESMCCVGTVLYVDGTCRLLTSHTCSCRSVAAENLANRMMVFFFSPHYYSTCIQNYCFFLLNELLAVKAIGPQDYASDPFNFPPPVP